MSCFRVPEARSLRWRCGQGSGCCECLCCTFLPSCGGLPAVFWHWVWPLPSSSHGVLLWVSLYSNPPFLWEHESYWIRSHPDDLTFIYLLNKGTGEDWTRVRTSVFEFYNMESGNLCFALFSFFKVIWVIRLLARFGIMSLCINLPLKTLKWGGILISFLLKSIQEMSESFWKP